MLFTLAIRNIFRNKRRSLITISAVCFAVFLSSTMRSFQKGVWDSVINNTVNSSVGFIQVHQQGFWDDKTLETSAEYNETLRSISDLSKKIVSATPRLESMALASAGDYTQGVFVMGVDPALEHGLTGVADKVIEGKYLQENDVGTIVGAGVAKKLKLSLGDTLVMISQGYHGVNAAGKFPIQGIVKFDLPELDKRWVMLSLPRAQQFYGAEGRVTSLALKLNDKDHINAVSNVLKEKLDPAVYEVMDYEQLMPELVQARKMDEAGGLIVLGILYALITFAIFGTIVMMTKERSYEFGVLTAIGMRRPQLFSIVFMENILVALVGALVGILLSIPIVYYLNQNPLDMSGMAEGAVEVYEKFGMNPIFPAAFEFKIFFNQAMLIFMISCILGIYPLLKILRLHPIKAMRS